MGLMFFSIDFVVGSSAFYNWQFRINDTHNELALADGDLERVRDRLIDYFAGRADCLQVEVTFIGENEPRPFYTDDELCHMNDVRIVFAGFRAAAVVLVILGVGGLMAIAALQKGKDLSKSLSTGAIGAGAGFIGFFAVVALFVSAFWEAAFDIFHQVLFPQGNWSFANSNMIAMLPGTLFFIAAMIIVSVGFIFAAFFLGGGIAVKIVSRKSKSRV